MADEECDVLLPENYNSICIGELLHRLQTRSTGLTQAEARLRREVDGLNIIPSPLRLPKWLCCLLPCLADTAAMRLYQSIIPDYCEVQREGVWRNIDPSGVVKGDIVRMNHGLHAPADMRIIEIFESATVDSSFVLPHSELMNVSTCNNDDCADYANAKNIVLAGSLCVKGQFIGVVVATGSYCYLSQAIRNNEWPPKKSSSR